jgi:sialic acid synthase SpsE
MITVAAEIGMAHNGDPSKVAAYAQAAKACGVDVLKLQCHLPEESSDLEPWRVPPASGETRLQYWTRTAWDVPTWRKVGQDIHAAGLKFGCSVFSLEAVALLKQVPELDIWKVPSGVSEWRELVDAVEADTRPAWGSMGLSGSDLAEAWYADRYLLPMNCTSLYPCPAVWSGLGLYRARPGRYHGWSDHTGDPALIYAAIGAGATVVEVHFEPDGWAGTTPDSSASWNMARLTDLVQGIRRIEQGLASTDKDAIAAATAHLRPYYVPTRLNGRIAKWGGQGEPV